MRTSFLKPSSFLAAVASLLAAGIVGCGSPVDAGLSADAAPFMKGGTSTSTIIPTEREPNDQWDLSRDIIGTILGGSLAGTVSTASDVDFSLVHAVLPGREASATLSVPAGLDYDIQILDDDGVTVLASNHQGPGRSESVRLKNPTSVSKQYYLRVFSADGSFSTTAKYTITVGKVI